MRSDLFLEPSQIDLSVCIADKQAIRQMNPQRFAMEHLDAIVSIDSEQHLIVGYKDVRDDEFWVSGHMPGLPLLPGVIMCEAAAQLTSYYTAQTGVITDKILGLGGIDNARFRQSVKPGDRLVLVGKGVRVNRRQTIFSVQGFVNNQLAFNCDIIGLPIADKVST
ncbi:3-hydroxyacyl-ACP dehydratase FabZ family protein [Tuwongella immobilis]|uniref:Beta-hydroxyacyl-ACP dehydratase n=1 Tax=Tuwongella immobilis TaxID=692036 RepID=A0A6C2YQP4_9BACT|nr:3-hydroxyacyl-ACP dehydratase FabZ family protein [Tuwongella immobilis]VIP03677.1 Beta-hydroxyacyl-(Acyl-carrier-protein) dehydratase FabA/FabZ OS=Isosphaera pallida (strain ATCC 43644 / DSM 9630 / IS1B) GN=Isop_0858 PE=4 SV=1: FabA [Tuwongella immobilis]VTS04722.1 Beta-hydroxyacyl-(Acyl-carrier-protein) dehydratase FabA/FabZ OS=Isosphaera pallida (strain ATCC 43644 / DSM 9630 / IS1B) GN=Isop_0858 PE=4 SV=1: FabA [Tuwongella immobilis]